MTTQKFAEEYMETQCVLTIDRGKTYRSGCWEVQRKRSLHSRLEVRMDNIRLVAPHSVLVDSGCSTCTDARSSWDRIANKAYCPDCMGLLAQGETEPLLIQTEKHQCAVCFYLGTVRYLIRHRSPRCLVEIDLCGVHLRALIGRCLGPHSFFRLRQQLHDLGMETDDFFLLHDAFYDSHGRALQPADTS